MNRPLAATGTQGERGQRHGGKENASHTEYSIHKYMRKAMISSFPSLLRQGHLVMDVELGNLFLAGRRTGAEVSRVASDLIAERLAGERVNRQRHGNVGEFRGQGAVVLRGVETQGLDVSEKCDPLVHSPLRVADVLQARQQGIGEQCRRLLRLVLGSQRFALPDGKVYGF